MAKYLLLLFIYIFSLQNSFAQKPGATYVKLKISADSAKSSITDLDNYLQKQHPGYYRYTSKKEFISFIDSIKQSIHDSLSELEAYRKINPIMAKVNCLHTEMSLPAKYTAYLNLQANLFPFQVYFKGDRAYITKNFSGIGSIVPGDEITDINGRPIKDIRDKLFAQIGSDGYNLTLKYLELYYNFPVRYRDCIELTDNYSFTVLHDGKQTPYIVKAAKYKDIACDWFLKQPKFPKKLEFRTENNTGFLTIHTFDEPDIKNGGQDFKKWIEQTFVQLKTENIPNLVIDLRNNDGGEDTHAENLVSYFFDKPFRYWDRIEVTETVAKSIKGAKTLAIFDPPVYKDSAWQWLKAKNTTTEFDFYETQQPAKNNYTGKVYLLTNGFCESSCADIAAILSYNKKVVLVGEETGGGFQGNNSGITPENVTMKPMDFVLEIPMQKYFNAVDPKLNVARGAMPDYPVDITVEDLIKGNDKGMELVLRLIRERVK